MLDVQNGQTIPGPDFPDRMLAGLRASGSSLVLCTIGTWLIKFNFLCFFYRLGYHVRLYLIFWWIAFALVMACGAVILGVIHYSCSFGSWDYLVNVCSTAPKLHYIYTVYKVGISMDVFSDVISK